jgi:hypothetical protein
MPNQMPSTCSSFPVRSAGFGESSGGGFKDVFRACLRSTPY